jgi:hypothetical protein
MVTCLDIHRYLLSRFPEYEKNWHSLFVSRESMIGEQWQKIDARVFESDEAIDLYMDRCEKALQRFFVRLAECQYKQTRIRSDLAMLSSDRTVLENKLDYFQAELSRFSSALHGLPGVCYGGVKEITAIQKSMIRRYKSDDNYGKFLNTDYRDLVRFRFVYPNRLNILRVAHQFWEHFFDEIVYCKNYYLNPIATSKIRPYRGIHFLIIDKTGFPAEIQIVTAVREAVGILDHKLIYKADIHGVPKDYLTYIKTASMYANILDFENFMG